MKLLQQFSFFLCFFRGKVAIGIYHFPYIELAVVECLGHGKAFCRTNSGAKATIAAFCHIDIELGSIQPDNRSVGGPAYFFRSFDRFYLYAVYRTHLGAFVAYNAVVHLVVQPVAAVVGDRDGFLRVLDGYHARLYLEEIIQLYVIGFTAPTGLPGMAQRKPHTSECGSDSFRNIFKIAGHNFSAV